MFLHLGVDEKICFFLTALYKQGLMLETEFSIVKTGIHIVTTVIKSVVMFNGNRITGTNEVANYKH